jgi:hypothetical protein
VQALADGLKAQITNGMDPAKAALVYVEVTNCKVGTLFEECPAASWKYTRVFA